MQQQEDQRAAIAPGASGRGAGVGLAVGSAAAFGTSGAFAGSLLAQGWSPAAAVTVRVVLGALLVTIPAVRQLRRAEPLSRSGVRSVAVYGLVAVAGAQLCYFNAVQTLSVAVALLIEYSGVLLVVVWLWLRQGLRPRRLTVVGAAVALGGLGLVLDLLGSADLDPVGVLWGLGAAVGLATYFVLSARDDDAPPPLVVAWGGPGRGRARPAGRRCGRGCSRLRASGDDVELVGAQVSWLVPVVGLSLVAAAVAYVTGIAAARLLGATLASFVGLTEVLFAVVFAWLLLGQTLGPAQLVGGLAVLAGVALVRLDDLRRPPAGTPTGVAPAVAVADVSG